MWGARSRSALHNSLNNDMTMDNKIDQTQELINEARDLMESFDDCAAMTIGYDKKEYTLTAKQMNLIAGALYLADCKLNQNKDE